MSLAPDGGKLDNEEMVKWFKIPFFPANVFFFFFLFLPSTFALPLPSLQPPFDLFPTSDPSALHSPWIGLSSRPVLF